MRPSRALALAALLSTAALAGCFGKGGHDGADGDAGPLVPVQDRHLEAFRTTDPGNCRPMPCAAFYSHVLHNGTYRILDGRPVDVPVSLPPTQGAPAALGLTNMHLGLFLPDIPGCDWSASSLPDQCKVPVVADAGPYYSSSKGVPDLQSEGDTVAEEPAHRLGAFLIENLVPHGYAVAQVSVFGTGDSGHCQDLMGTAEQAGLDAVVTWLGTQAWSNGRVAMTGRSYDGSTPWEAATFGNPHLVTIVPISGLTSVFDLMYHNGTSESRGAAVLYGLYAAMTVDGDTSDSTQALCPDYALGGPEGLKATLAGNPTPADPYWADRVFLDPALQNYKGSIYLIHGLQDWNVDPHMAFPAYNLFEAKGTEVKALLGQWFHNYPDRPTEHSQQGPGRGAEAYPESVRYDWAQDMLEWFDYTLKGGPKPDLHVEVQDNQGQWRIEPTWPPASQRQDVPVVAAQQATGESQAVTATDTLHFDLGALSPDRDVRFSGLPHLQQWVTPTGPGGQVYAELVDLDANGIHLGHAIMDLRYNDGGREPHPVAPGVALQARLEFEPLDVVLPAGHRLGLWFSATGEDYVGPTVTDPVLLSFGEGQAADNRLELPIIDPSPSQFFTPPAWTGGLAGSAPGT